MKHGIIKLPPNRVRRNYYGGAGIDRLHGDTQCKDTNQPEEWIGSLVAANNPGMEYIQDEGQAFIISDQEKILLKDLFIADTEFYLGEKYVDVKEIEETDIKEIEETDIKKLEK